MPAGHASPHLPMLQSADYFHRRQHENGRPSQHPLFRHRDIFERYLMKQTGAISFTASGWVRDIAYCIEFDIKSYAVYSHNNKKSPLVAAAPNRNTFLPLMFSSIKPVNGCTMSSVYHYIL